MLLIMLIYVNDDCVVSVYNSEVMVQVLVRVGVEYELYVFVYGGYGFGMCLQFGFILVQWLVLVQVWLIVGKGVEGS